MCPYLFVAVTFWNFLAKSTFTSQQSSYEFVLQFTYKIFQTDSALCLQVLWELSRKTSVMHERCPAWQHLFKTAGLEHCLDAIC